MPEWEFSETYDCRIWRPLVDWTQKDVIAIHTRHGLRPNPNYLLGAERVGCWPCVYSRKSEIRAVAARDPERIAIIRDLEEIMTTRRRDRAKARGDDPDQITKPTFFNPVVNFNRDEWGIDAAVEWSRTRTGGKQFELFAARPQDSGCMRWGLCDTGTSQTSTDDQTLKARAEECDG